MMMGYYDINGYGGLSYSNLVPGEWRRPPRFLLLPFMEILWPTISLPDQGYVSRLLPVC